MSIIFENGRIFTTSSPRTPDLAIFESAMLVTDGLITHIGNATDKEIVTAREKQSITIDLNKRLVLPGFIDGHMHLVMHGQSLTQCHLEKCRSLDDIRSVIKDYARANPNLPRIVCLGWQQYTTPGQVLATMLDGLDDRPIFVNAYDYHSVWCSSAGLAELALEDTPDPVGGRIFRDENGKPSGLLGETAALELCWPHLARYTTVEARVQAIEDAVKSYSAEGYTGLIEMAMNEEDWEALQTLRTRKDVPMRIAAHWLVEPRTTEEDCLKQVKRAIELRNEFNTSTSADCRITGIKIISDGVVDSCTAGLHEPYANGTTAGDLIWSEEMLLPVVKAADAAGLQIAIHAIGDRAITQAVDALASLGTTGKRHRIEHLELTSPSDARRLGQLGITASIQPMHSDPAILRAWPQLLGSNRCDQAFPYKDILDHGAVLALGTDSPTAPYTMYGHLYCGSTRKSAQEPGYEGKIGTTPPIPLVQVICAATAGAAYSCFAENRVGRLEAGLKADFQVVNMVWKEEDLLKAKVEQTWFEGRKVYDVHE